MHNDLIKFYPVILSWAISFVLRCAIDMILTFVLLMKSDKSFIDLD